MASSDMFSVFSGESVVLIGGGVTAVLPKGEVNKVRIAMFLGFSKNKFFLSYVKKIEYVELGSGVSSTSMAGISPFTAHRPVRRAYNC